MVAVATGAKEKRAITMANLATPGTDLASIMRVNKGHGYTLLQSLVFYKFLELGKRPGLVDIPLPLSSFGTLPDVLEGFHYQYIVWGGGLDYPLTDYVVKVADYPALLARKPFQELLSISCAFGLERSPQIGKMPPYMHGSFAGKPESKGSSSKVIDTAVYADRIPSFWSGDRFREDDVNIISPLPAIPSVDYSSRGRFLPFEEMPLVVAQGKWDFNPAFNSRKGYHFPIWDIAENPLVIRNRSWLELSDLAEFSFGTFSHPGNGSDGKIGRQSIAVSYIPVAKMLKLYLVCCPILFRNFKHIIADIGKIMKGCSQSFSLFGASVKFARDCLNKLHINLKYITFRKQVSSAFLPPLKRWASCA